MLFPTPPVQDQIKPEFLHTASNAYTDNFQILFLCDGFGVGESTVFYNFCNGLVSEFLKISPFDVCKEHINILAHFTESAESIIDGNKKTTAFDFYIDGIITKPDGTVDISSALPKCSNLQKIKDAVKKITFRHARCRFTGKNVWLNPLNRSYGAICVVLKTDKSYRPVANPPNFFTICVNQSKLGDKYNIIGWAGDFVHELGHSIKSYTEMSDGFMSSKKIGLGDEYREFPMAYPVEIRGEPLEPNLTAALTINYSPLEVDTEHLKWRKLASSDELLRIKNRISVTEFSEFDPNDPIFDPLVHEITYKDSIDKIELVEGGRRFGSGIFHPNQVCRMRSRRLHYFCVVCQHHIIRAISGLHRTRPVVVNAVDITGLMASQKLRKRLIRSLKYHVWPDGRLENLSLANRCGIAVGRMAIMLSQLGIPLDHLQIGIVQGHGFLLYRKVIIDPTFYQLYRDGNSYEYQYDNKGTIDVKTVPQGTAKADHPGVHFSNGFVGDVEQLLRHFQLYWPKTWPLWSGDASDTKYAKFEEKARAAFDVPGYELKKASGWQLQMPNRSFLSNLDQEVANDIEAELNSYEEFKKNLPGRYQASQRNAVKTMYDPLNLSIKLPKES